jgi:tRNA threonylcarbamoyladenosine biosynthesis protein TsaE
MRKTATRTDLETRAVGAELGADLTAGDVVLFEGALGSGKTTMIRGLLESLGFTGPVRSPTFNLIQMFETSPPVMHADLYRLKDAQGLGLEDYLATHLCLIEWPDRLHSLIDPTTCFRVSIDFTELGRIITIERPYAKTSA